MSEFWAVKRDSHCFWLESGCGGGGLWCPKERRQKFATRAAALNAAASVAPHNGRVHLVHVSKKPKSPPPLIVGDEVVVRGKVHSGALRPPFQYSAESPPTCIDVLLSSNTIIRPSVADCERVKP